MLYIDVRVGSWDVDIDAMAIVDYQAELKTKNLKSIHQSCSSQKKTMEKQQHHEQFNCWVWVLRLISVSFSEHLNVDETMWDTNESVYSDRISY